MDQYLLEVIYHKLCVLSGDAFDSVKESIQF